MVPRSAIASTLFAAAAALWSAAPSRWVYYSRNHSLEYRTDARGNRIMDFSYAGYRGGGVRLPAAAVARMIKPEAGDATARIQQAIDAVSALPPNAEGVRGAVLLEPGVYEVHGSLTIATGGVVLRGSGSGEKGTTLRMTGAPHRLLQIRGEGTYQTVGHRASIIDSYVPSGSDNIEVDDASGFHTGDTVLISRPVRAEWIHFMGMDTLVRDGKKQTWIAAGSTIETDRVVRAVERNRIRLDVPLSDAIDGRYGASSGPGANIIRYTFPGRIAEVGVEDLRVSAPLLDKPISEPQYTFLAMNAVTDGWVKNVAIEETENGISLGGTVKRVTLDSVQVRHSQPHSGAAAPADFSLSGTQILLNRCSVDGEGTWPVVTQARVTGPIVILNFSGTATAGVSPHQRWATGVLVDGARLPNTNERHPGVAFSNRKTAGSGHGWDVGWAVAWNVVTPYFLVQQPPGAMNWCIGCIGQPVTQAGVPEGVYDSLNSAVDPPSLYLAQLRERLGDKAVANIGY
jgi:hypothetical protein